MFSLSLAGASALVQLPGLATLNEAPSPHRPGCPFTQTPATINDCHFNPEILF